MRYTCRLVVVHIDALQLEVRVAGVDPRRVDAALVGHHLPELRPELVASDMATMMVVVMMMVYYITN